MRAIIKCDAEVTKGQFFRVIDQIRWMPAFDQDDQEVVSHKTEILNLVSSEDQKLVERTYWFMIYHNPTKSWGLVNSPQSGIVEVRIRNREAVKLKKACEVLVENLVHYTNGKDPQDPKKTKFTFPQEIEVLEPGSLHHAFSGEVLSLDLWGQAKEERRAEWKVGVIATIASVVLLLITIPPLAQVFRELMGLEWEVWLTGTIGRLATSAVTTAAVSFLTVLIHFFNLRRAGRIRWSLR